jgi:hypothetical protein
VVLQNEGNDARGGWRILLPAAGGDDHGRRAAAPRVLLEADVEARGGTFVACDTDSLLIVASREGGLVACPGGPRRLPDGRRAVTALSWAQVDEIVAGFARLSPYDRALVPSLLKLEDENFGNDGHREELWAIGISAKRYVLYNRTDAGVVVRKPSEHGLGLYRRPIPDLSG